MSRTSPSLSTARQTYNCLPLMETNTSSRCHRPSGRGRPGGTNSPHGLILFDGVCVLCSRGCRFVSKRDRRGYFRFVPIQLAEGRPLAEQLGIDPDRPDSFAFVANGQAYVKPEAALRIARELPRWHWTWAFHFIPRVIRDAIYDVVARNRYRWFGRRDACILPNSDRSWPS